MNESEKKSIKARNALSFLDNHPAYINPLYGSFMGKFYFGIDPVCKRGIFKSAKKMLTVYHGDKGWEKFKDKFKKECSAEEIKNKTCSIYVKYEDLYDEEWQFDRICYWYEVNLSIFHGDFNKDTDDYDYKKWDNYQGFMGGNKTFEDMLIEIARKTKKYYGNFSLWNDSLLSTSEIENHKKEDSFHFVPCEEKEEKKNLSLNKMEKNKKHFYVSDGLKNLRWLAWFSKTDLCKKDWGNQFNWISKKNLYPYD